MITQENEKIAVDCLKVVLTLIHEQRYKELNTVVDKIHYDKLDEVLCFIEESIYPYMIDGFDPEVEYHLYELGGKKGFGLDYPLTSCGVKLSGILCLSFEYTDNGLVRIIHTIDAD
ncbi:MAG: hypothetical protein K2N73_03530 [Lachnospiraceae bacterium]|nr:hypothetical protein [Lachnospiraceae bacterium]